MADGICFKRHRFPPDVIRYAVWLYFRFTLSIRDVEELLAERGIKGSTCAARIKSRSDEAPTLIGERAQQTSNSVSALWLPQHASSMPTLRCYEYMSRQDWP